MSRCFWQVPVQLRGQCGLQQAVVLRRHAPPGHVAVGAGEDHKGDQPLWVRTDDSALPTHMLPVNGALCTLVRIAKLTTARHKGPWSHGTTPLRCKHMRTAWLLSLQGVCHQVPNHPLQPAHRQPGEAGRQAGSRPAREPEARRPQLRLAGDWPLFSCRHGATKLCKREE